MTTLVSPGVHVSVTDESPYASAGEGTVPLIIIGTHAYKSQPSGSGVAEGTLPENANKLYNITSQRELLQTFGNPLFYTKSGSSVHGYELNEFGLHAAYSYLGIANRAYVIRGNVDYLQLIPKASAPTGEPMTGTYWLDTNLTSWGVFESNGGSVPGTAWSAQNTLVVDDSSMMDDIILGTKGYADSVGDVVLAGASTLIINTVSVSLSTNITLQGIVTAITNAAIPNVVATVHRLAGLSYLLLSNTGSGTLVIGSSSTSTLLTALGLAAPGTVISVPKPTLGLDGDYAVITAYNDNIIYQKIKAEGVDAASDVLGRSFWYRAGSSEWRMTTPTRVVGTNAPGSIVTSDTLNISVNGSTLTAVSMSGVTNVQDAVDAINDAVDALASNHVNKALKAYKPGSAIIITNTAGGDVYLSSSGTVLTVLGLTATTKGNIVNYAPHYQIPTGSVSGDVWIKTTNPNNGADWTIKVYNAVTGAWSLVSAPLLADDTAANTLYGTGKVVGNLYVRYNLLGSSSIPIASHQIRIWTGAQWEALVYEASEVEPTAAPEEGTYWFNTNLRVDVMVCDGDQWKGYLNYSGYSGTDPNGVILAGSMPATQSTGSALVSNDLWINTSDTENYPKMYRYSTTTQSWVLIDLSDQTTPFGVVFGDARATSDGSDDGSEAIADMLESDYCDPDAPDPRLYPDGMLLFNTRFSTNNVKEWRPDYLAGEFMATDYTVEEYDVGASAFDPVPSAGRWVTVSGVRTDGVPYFGRKAQRHMIVKALAATLVGNEDIRSENLYFNLIAAPGYIELTDEMQTLNKDKKEVAFIVADSPARLRPTGTDLQRWAQGTNAGVVGNSEEGLVTADPYIGVYYPWGMGTNVDGNNIMIPPSTMALRTLAYNDNVGYPWTAPAGFTRGIVSNAASVGYLDSENEYRAVMLSEGLRDVLYANNVNPIAHMPNKGLVVFGQKTRHAISSALDRINVARLINYLRYHLDNLGDAFLFEANDQHTRDAVQTAFSRFMGDLVGKRALYDFLVQCDETNNTPERIDRNELWVDIAIQPEKTIEFIYIPVRIVNTGTDMQALYNPNSRV